jgi:hypothetical protein
VNFILTFHFALQKKTSPAPCKSGRLATKNLKQTVLILNNDTTVTEKESISKRKLEESNKSINKKQKTIHDTLSIEEKSHSLKQVLDEKDVTESKDTIEEATITKEKDASPETVEDANQTDTTVEEPVITKEKDSVELVEEQTITKDEDTVKDQEETITNETVVIEQVEISETEQTLVNEAIIQEALPFEQKETSLSQSQPEDSPSPPSALSLFNDEPATPPSLSVAPFKEYLTPADKQRITYEKTTLQKVRKALDIVITDRAARNRPTLYHQIEPVLRNSTQRTITLSHICKVMYLSPSLYTLEAKELRNFGGKVTEAFVIEFGKDWIVPLNGKDLQKRAELLTQSVEHYFETHCQVCYSDISKTSI